MEDGIHRLPGKPGRAIVVERKGRMFLVREIQVDSDGGWQRGREKALTPNQLKTLLQAA